MKPAAAVAQDAQLSAKWTAFLELDECKSRVEDVALQYPDIESVVFSFNEIQLRDPDLANYLLARPQQCLRVGEQVLHQVAVTVDPRPRLHLRIGDLPSGERVTIAQLATKHAGRLHAIEGLVKVASEIIPAVEEAVFECKACTTRARILQDEESLLEPVHCNTCERPSSWRLVVDESRWVDVQDLDIQEAPEGLRGDQPARVQAYLGDDLVRRVKAGNRVRLNGVLEFVPRREGKSQSRLFAKRFMVLSVELLETSFDDMHLTSEDEAQARKNAKKRGWFEHMIDHVAPDVVGLRDVKEAVLLALFSSSPPRGNIHKRGDIHIALVGPPGCGKSQVLASLAMLAPRIVHVDGKTTTTVGLTGTSVAREGGGKRQEWSVEAGALPSADGGMCTIDEIQSLEPKDQDALKPAMEAQVIHITKAGTKTDLRTRCSIVTASNPPGGAWDPNLAIDEQLGFDAAMRTRFDLIFALQLDRSKAFWDALMDLQIESCDGGESPKGPPAAVAEIRKYIAVGRRIQSRIAKGSAAEKRHRAIVEEYRAKKSDLNPRTTAGLLRLMRASARAHLRDVVDVDDVERAHRLFIASLTSLGAAKSDGKLDVGIIAFGASKSHQERLSAVREIVRQLARESATGSARELDILEAAIVRGLSKENALAALTELRRSNQVYQKSGPGTYAPLGA